MTNEKILELLNTQKTPFYVFDLNEVESRIKLLSKQLGENIKLCYAVKANSFISKKVSELVDYLEICSPGEYNICEKLHLPRNKYVISGVNKDEEHIDEAISKDESIGCYTAESIHQFNLLLSKAQKYSKRITVLLRLTSSNQFGIDEEDVVSLINDYKDNEFIDIIGIQYFSGTQKTSLKKLRRELDYCDKVITRLNDEICFKVRKLEYGTGFPVSYFDEDQFDEIPFLNEFSTMLNEMTFKGEIVLEIGRSIAASCGTYLTKVVDLKCNKNEHYAIVDGGMHQITYYGQSMAMKHPKMRLFPLRDDADTIDWNICGSLCTINDYLVKRVPLTDLKIGDVLAFENAGAYCVTEGISLFLTRDLPSVLLLDENNSFKVVRNKIETELFNTPQNI